MAIKKRGERRAEKSKKVSSVVRGDDGGHQRGYDTEENTQKMTAKNNYHRKKDPDRNIHDVFHVHV